ncbi:Fur family transcriptional regulator [Marinobacteraceae bacterium S3BR75-40.1]
MAITVDPYEPHDHSACRSQALAEAEQLCARRGARLTAIRQQVLELVWQSHRPLGAYDLLGELNAEGGRTAPPTVYRALDFLQQMGLVHRIASLNAYIGCPRPSQQHRGCFLICQQCQNVLELKAEGVNQALGEATRAQGFSMADATIEISGLCSNCQEGTPA